MDKLTITPLDLQSERYSATGNIASDGVLNQLGRPNLDILTVLIREAVQNSWDARVNDNSTVRFGIHGRTLNDTQMHFLRKVIFANTSNYSHLNDVLRSKQNFQILTLYDRGTTGLGGPTRADRILDENTPRNFVNFLRNVGLPSDKHFGGGTFGYGKSALYLASNIRTICIHTRCYSQHQLESRFMVTALGPRSQMRNFEKERYQHTGRHWWGRNEEGIVEPVRNVEADAIAQHLGLPCFIDNECGTTIVILLPVLGERSLLQTIQLAGAHILWNCWPKMLTIGQEKPSMIFDLAYEEQSIWLSNPYEFPPLQGFALAMENLKCQPPDSESNILSQLVSIECYSPKQRLGKLSLQRFPVKKRHEKLTDEEDFFPFTGSSRHIALMRKPELVVKYLQGPPLPSGQIEYAGVFLVDELVDSIFAKAEPPTHDDWAYQSLDDPREKRFVRVALRRLEEALQDFTSPPSNANKSVGLLPLGEFADQLGSLLLGSEGPGASTQPFPQKKAASTINSTKDSKKKKTKKEPLDNKVDPKEKGIAGNRNTRRARIYVMKTVALGFSNGIPALLTEFMVEHTPNSLATKVKVEVSIVLDGEQLEKDPPIGGQIPRVLFWTTPDKRSYRGGHQLEIPSSSTGTWAVAVSIPDDAVIRVNLSISEVL